MPRITVTDREGVTREIDAPVGEPLMFTLRDRAGLPVEGLCGGCAVCGTCHVYVDAAWIDRLKPREEIELELLEALAQFDERASRLSCQIKPTADLEGLALRLAPEE
jgi:2Fe-2S ferredoxin